MQGRRLRSNKQRRSARNTLTLSILQPGLQQGKHSRPINASSMKKSGTESETLITRKKRKKKTKKERKKESEAAFKNKVINARAKGSPEKWNVDELKTMVLWYKRPGDNKIPTTNSALYQRYLLTCMRSEEDRSRL
jgi:hypothetical protein